MHYVHISILQLCTVRQRNILVSNDKYISVVKLTSHGLSTGALALLLALVLTDDRAASSSASSRACNMYRHV
jgi:hypothetical protein